MHLLYLHQRCWLCRSFPSLLSPSPVEHHLLFSTTPSTAGPLHRHRHRPRFPVCEHSFLSRRLPKPTEPIRVAIRFGVHLGELYDEMVTEARIFRSEPCFPFFILRAFSVGFYINYHRAKGHVVGVHWTHFASAERHVLQYSHKVLRYAAPDMAHGPADLTLLSTRGVIPA